MYVGWPTHELANVRAIKYWTNYNQLKIHH